MGCTFEIFLMSFDDLGLYWRRAWALDGCLEPKIVANDGCFVDLSIFKHAPNFGTAIIFHVYTFEKPFYAQKGPHKKLLYKNCC